MDGPFLRLDAADDFTAFDNGLLSTAVMRGGREMLDELVPPHAANRIPTQLPMVSNGAAMNQCVMKAP